MLESLFSGMAKGGEEVLNGAVGVHSGNHWKQRGKEAYFGGTFDARRQQHREHPDGKGR